MSKEPAGVPFKNGYGFVDCDVHEYFISHEELAPYLKQPWKDWVKHWNGIYKTSHVGVHPLLNSKGQEISKRVLAGDKTGIAGVDFEMFRRDHLDKYNVQYAILNGFFYTGVMKTQPEFAVAVTSAYNDWFIENWLERDERILGTIQITPQEPEAAVREIERLGDHPRMVQVMLPLTDVAYGEPRYHPIFAAAERHNLIVTFHPTHYTVTPVGQTMRHNIEWHASFPLNFMSQVISLVFEGVFDKYPGTKVLMIEGGFTWLPHIMWRLDSHYKNMRVEVPWVKRMPSETIREHFRFGTQPMDDINAKQLMSIFELVGSDDFLVFSSDYPHWDSDEPTRMLPSGLSEELRQKIMYKNALEFFGLKSRL